VSEQYSDLIDRANYIAEAATQEAVDHVRRLAAPEQDPDDLDPDCVDCGNPIEEVRLQMLKCRCVSCQTIKEKKEKMYGRY